MATNHSYRQPTKPNLELRFQAAKSTQISRRSPLWARSSQPLNHQRQHHETEEQQRDDNCPHRRPPRLAIVADFLTLFRIEGLPANPAGQFWLEFNSSARHGSPASRTAQLKSFYAASRRLCQIHYIARQS